MTAIVEGLTADQAWTLEHIVRCPCCGTWEVIDHLELRQRAAMTAPPLISCTHLDHGFIRQENETHDRNDNGSDFAPRQAI